MMMNIMMMMEEEMMMMMIRGDVERLWAHVCNIQVRFYCVGVEQEWCGYGGWS